MSWAEAKKQIDWIASDAAGLVPQRLGALKVVPGDGQATIYITDADDTVVDGQTLCTVKGAIVRYSADGYPATPDDGTLALKTTEPGQYGTDTDGYTLTGLTNEETLYFSAFSCSDHGIANFEARTQSAMPSEYGICIVTVSSDRGTIEEELTITLTDEDGVVVDTMTVSEAGSYQFTVDLGVTYSVSVSDISFHHTPDASESCTAAAGIVNEVDMEYEYRRLFGFKIEKANSDPSDRVTYLDDCENADFTPAAVDLDTGEFDYGSWADYWFVTDNRPCMLTSDGYVDYYLDPDDYTLQEDGETASDISNTSYDGNGMAQIPLVWLKQYEDDDYMYCYVSDFQLDDDYKAYAHTREDGTVAEYKYLSLFEGSVSSSKLRSIKGLTPANTNTGTAEITYATANGDLWYTRTIADRNLINMLLVLMAKTMDTQEAYGYGYYTGGSSSSPNRLTTGGGSSYGQFYGTDSTRDYVKVFHLENWWGDMWDRTAGCVTDSSGNICVQMTPPYDTSGTDYTDTGITPSGTSGGYISAESMDGAYGFLPTTASGSSSTYTPDGLWYASTCYALCGGNCASGWLVGAFALYLNSAVSRSDWTVGAALSCEQPSEA